MLCNCILKIKMQICWCYNLKNSTLNFWNSNCYFPFVLNPFRLMKYIWKNLEDEMLQVWKIKCDSNYYYFILHCAKCFLLQRLFINDKIVHTLVIYITRVCTVTLNAGTKTSFDFSQSILSFILHELNVFERLLNPCNKSLIRIRSVFNIAPHLGWDFNLVSFA